MIGVVMSKGGRYRPCEISDQNDVVVAREVCMKVCTILFWKLPCAEVQVVDARLVRP
jgi:hypothetical protein